MFSSFHAYIFINFCLPFDEKPASFWKEVTINKKPRNSEELRGFIWKQERKTGLEPATLTLARLCSTN